MMIKRVVLPLFAGVVLAACQPAIPESGRGVGFDGTLEDLQRQRAAQAAAAPAQSTGVISNAPLESSAASAPPGSAAETAAETQRVLAATRTGTPAPAPATVGTPAIQQTASANQTALSSGQGPLQASPSNPAPELVNTAAISRENNFDAVSSQRSIEGDAALRARNQAQYEVVQPQALPRRESAGPNVVAYALQTSHPRGTQVYRRIGFNRQAKFERACAPFANADEAQIAFLAAGGPERDRQGMDPDGDGYACSWDPTPFRRAAQGG